MTGFRHATAGRIDRSRTLRFEFDGVSYHGHPGDTLASALLANGVGQVATSGRLGRPRGIFAAGGDEPNAVVQIEQPFPEPMRQATTVELYDGLVASSLAGRGRLADRPDPARYDARYAHCDVLVVGAGPAGLTAASDAAGAGARVILADEQAEPGGSLLGTAEHVDGMPGTDWALERAGTLQRSAGVQVLTRTTVFGYYDHNYLMAVERRTDHLGSAAPRHLSRERIWRIRAGRVVLATGAHERSLVFACNDRPGVMLAGAARTYLHRYGAVPGHRAVLLTGDDGSYAAAVELAAAGVAVAAIADIRPGGTGDPDLLRRCAEHGIDVLDGWSVVEVSGADRVDGVSLAPIVQGSISGGIRDFDADLLLVSGGWSPAVHLFSQAGGTLRYEPGLAAFVPASCRQQVRVTGAADGTQRARTPTAPVAVLPGLDGGEYQTHFVDLARDVTVDDIRRATRAGLRSAEHVKRYTTAGTGHDQGKTSGLLTSGVVAELLGVGIAETGVTTFRPPYTPVSFAALAGRDRGGLHDPVRVTGIHPWHVARGAAFENVGQWKRPWYYPLPGEDMTAAVLRECRAARRNVAFMDASTLGKIDVRGPDSAEFLDRLYTNRIGTLKIGSIRYAVMCRPDGMVFDDGTVIRVAAHRFLVTTTTGNAAAVLDWMEEWLQTEWPQLRVRCTSVTDHFTTVAIAGPKSRELLAGLAPALDVSAIGFPFMTWRDTCVADLAARVCRISFSGELAYEVNVESWHGLALWEAIAAAGARLGITPYGTETMHVLRAEKGYPIIGQDTDGTVTPQDLGMGWVVSKDKPDFIGKRSFTRADTARADRLHLVGLLPEDRTALIPEGAQIVETERLPAPPVPMLGHVTSSYRSAALDRTFALALVKGGRERVGRHLFVPFGDRVVPVLVTEPVLYDREGRRRDG